MIHIDRITWVKLDSLSMELVFSTHMTVIVVMPVFTNSGTFPHSLLSLTNRIKEKVYKVLSICAMLIPMVIVVVGIIITSGVHVCQPVPENQNSSESPLMDFQSMDRESIRTPEKFGVNLIWIFAADDKTKMENMLIIQRLIFHTCFNAIVAILIKQKIW